MIFPISLEKRRKNRHWQPLTDIFLLSKKFSILSGTWVHWWTSIKISELKYASKMKLHSLEQFMWKGITNCLKPQFTCHSDDQSFKFLTKPSGNSTRYKSELKSIDESCIEKILFSWSRKTLVKFNAEGKEFVDCLRLSKQFIWAGKGQKNFWNRIHKYSFNLLLQLRFLKLFSVRLSIS